MPEEWDVVIILFSPELKEAVMYPNLGSWGLAKGDNLSFIQRKKAAVWEVPGTLSAAAAEHRAIPPRGRRSSFAVPAGVAAGCYRRKPPAIFISSKQMQSLPLNGYRML